MLPTFLAFLAVAGGDIDPQENLAEGPMGYPLPMPRSSYVQFLQQSISRLKRRNLELYRENLALQNYRTKYNEQANQLDDLEASNSSLSLQIKNCSAQMQENQKKINSFAEERKALLIELDKWRNLPSPSASKNKAVESDLEDLQKENDRLNDELQKTETSLRQYQDQIKQLTEKNDALQKSQKDGNQINWLNDQIQLKNKKITDLNQKIGELNEQNYTLNVSKNVLDQQLKEKNKLLDNAEKTHQQMLYEKQKLEDSLNSLQRELESLKKQNQLLND